MTAYKYRNQIRLVCYFLCLAAVFVWPAMKRSERESAVTVLGVYRFRVAAAETGAQVPEDRVMLKVDPERLETADVAPSWFGRRDMPKVRLPFAVLDVDADGMAKVTALVSGRKQVPVGQGFVRLDGIRHVGTEQKDHRVTAPYYYNLTFPFDNISIGKDRAATVQELLQSTKERPFPGVLTVKVFSDGSHQIEDLLVDGKSVL